MSMDLVMLKTPSGALVPGDSEATEALRKIKTGKALRMSATRMRNYEFHKKFFALVNFAYEHWEPGELPDARWRGVQPEKTFDRFRKDLIILAGFYEATYRLDGSVRIEAQSISFGRMDEDDFEALYSKVINVVLKHVLRNYTREDLDHVVEQILRFDG